MDRVIKVKAIDLSEGQQVKLLGKWCALLSKLWVSESQLSLVLFSLGEHERIQIMVDHELQLDVLEIL